MDKPHTPQGKKPGTDLLLTVVALAIAVILIFAAVGQIRSGQGLSTAVSICGVLLFGAAGVVLLVSLIRRWRKNHKQKG